METPENQAAFNLKRAAQYLGVDQYTLQGALRRNEIPHRRIGRRWIISKAVLDEWMRGGCCQEQNNETKFKD